MAAGVGHREGSVRPGALSALLQELARAPDQELGGGWGQKLRPGAVFGRFELVREIGRGGFGLVWEARDRELGRDVAFKAIRAGHRAALHEERLLREAETAARLTHPNLVTLYDVGRSECGPYLVLELLRGRSLAEQLEKGALPVLEAVRVGVETVKGVAHAHGSGVVHRDLKPANVFLCEDGQVKVLDFGLAHAFGQRRVQGGTSGYMAPEQESGAPEDERTDVFALGVILFEMLARELPFIGEKALRSAGKAPVLALPAAPALADLVARMLEKEPVKRPRDGAEVLAALSACQRKLEGAPISGAGRVRARRRPALRLAVLVAAGALIGAGGAALFARTAQHRRAAAAPALRPVLAVADFANETGEPEMDGLTGLLTTSLEQSTRVDVLPRTRLVDLLRAKGEEGPIDRIDEQMGREVARFARMDALLLSRLMRFGAAYVMEVRAIDPTSGGRRFSFTEQGKGKENVPELLDRVAERVRLALGEAPEALRESSIQLNAVTTSLEAWRNYARGMACFENRFFAGSFDACLADVQKAVAIDPAFALAHLQLSLLHLLQGSPRALQREAVEQALKHPERVPPHDRLRMRGWATFLEGKEVEAKGILRKAAEAAPDDKYAWWVAGDIAYHRDEFAEALPFFRRVHALDPSWVDAAYHLIHSLAMTGDLQGIRALGRELEQGGQKPVALVELCYADLWINPGRASDACVRARAGGAGALADEFLAIALLNRNEFDRLATLLAKMRKGKTGPEFAWYMSLWLRAQEGRWPEVERWAAAAGDPDDAWFHSTYAEMIAGSGDRERTWRVALRILELDRALLSNMSVHLAYLGDLARAAELAPYLPPDSPRADTYRAVVRWRQGDLQGAIELLRKIAAAAPQGADAPAIPPPLYLLGEALSEAGRDAEAVDVLQRFRAMPVIIPSWFLPRSLYFLARSLDRLGNRERAREAIGALLLQWRRAAPSQPLLAEARALGERLGVR